MVIGGEVLHQPAVAAGGEEPESSAGARGAAPGRRGVRAGEAQVQLARLRPNGERRGLFVARKSSDPRVDCQGVD